MALIPCKECGKEICCEAEVCPHCGVKTNYGSTNQESKNLNKSYQTWYVVGFIGVWTSSLM